MSDPAISFVIPAFRAAETIGQTLRSIYDARAGWRGDVEVIVVDDGSDDSAAMSGVLAGFAEVKVVRHEKNRGMCASRNTGIATSTGDIVTILDADDSMVTGWPVRLRKILDDWPGTVHVCFAACQTPSGRVTASDPEYSGFLTFDDLLNERHSGEYLPLFRGPYIRSRLYVDLRMRKSCGAVSYLTFAQDGPFWVTSTILRIYDDSRSGSVSQGWASREKADETSRCYAELIGRFGEAFRTRAPKVYRTKLLRYGVYLRFARRAGAWRAWAEGTSWRTLPASCASALLLMLGPAFATTAVKIAKQIGLIRRYG